MAFSVEVITLVPSIWKQLLSRDSGLVGRAFEDGRVGLSLNDLRAFGRGAHRQVDDAPFGGGAGMVLQVGPLHQAIETARQRTQGPVLLLSPRGKPFDQAMARRYAGGAGMTVVCGRYEGMDERVSQYVDEEVSVGDFVLSAGDPAAWCLIDSVVRLLPGVLGNGASIEEESFGENGLEYPQYTRPVEYGGVAVPDVLRSGNHAEIERWRRERSREKTRAVRPDLLRAGDDSEG